MIETLTAESAWQLVELDLAHDPVIRLLAGPDLPDGRPSAAAAGMAVVASHLDVISRWGDGPTARQWYELVAGELARRATP